jgi:hypothetical protein
MFTPITSRRRFLHGAAGAAAALGGFDFLSGLPHLAAADVKVKPETVQLNDDIEPLVRLMEQTPRDKCVAAVADKIKAGTSYQQLLSAVLLAGVRGIKPRPVGFQFHAVLVVHSAHLASLAATDQDRWLPLLWAVDNFKISQATNAEKNGGWMMPPSNETKLPAPAAAHKAFTEAMDDWNEEAADRAVAVLARTANPADVIEMFWRYGCRDFRDIGHKAIYVANAWRTLQTIGWRHAEPVLRSLVMALMEHEGVNPARRDADADRPFRENQNRAEEIGAHWVDGKRSPEATTDFLAAMRNADASGACDEVVALRKKRLHPQVVWDGLFLTAGELLMRQPGLVGIHCITSINALHHAYQATPNDETRRLLTLQGAAFLAMFRKAMTGRGKLAEVRLDALEPAIEKDLFTAESIFASVGKDRTQAARETLAVLQRDPGEAGPVMATARRLLFAKGDNSHDYKFSSAALEDYYAVSPHWRPRYLAACTVQLRGSGDKDNTLIQRTREALAKR